MNSASPQSRAGEDLLEAKHPTQRELENLFDLGIIKKRKTIDKVYYEIDPHSPFFKPLCEICEFA